MKRDGFRISSEGAQIKKMLKAEALASEKQGRNSLDVCNFFILVIKL